MVTCILHVLLFCFVGLPQVASAQWKSSISDTLTVYRTPFNVRLYVGEIRLSRAQGLEVLHENKSIKRKWNAGVAVSSLGFTTAAAGVGLSYVALKGEKITAEDITGKMVIYKARDQVMLAAGLLSFVLGASLVQVGVDKKIQSTRVFNTRQRVAQQDKVAVSFGCIATDKIGFTVKLP